MTDPSASARATLGSRTSKAAKPSKVRVPRPKPATSPWLGWTIAIVFGLFFAYDFWEALGNLIGLANVAASLSTRFSATGWVVLVGGLILPILCFLAALVFSRRMSPFAKLAVFVVALCASAVLALDVQLVFGLSSLLVLG
ncbi:hypothetical protein HQQ80_14800 [Microbacteriaceae bacterium VKM Ac-2855]|nr:hypothetical protein [Microbacteriaceae bacterium VKM Ac-2855]